MGFSYSLQIASQFSFQLTARSINIPSFVQLPFCLLAGRMELRQTSTPSWHCQRLHGPCSYWLPFIKSQRLLGQTDFRGYMHDMVVSASLGLKPS